MSYPSRLYAYNKNNEIIAYGFINVGWCLGKDFYTEDGVIEQGYTNVNGHVLSNELIKAIRISVIGIHSYNDNDYYYRSQDNWLNEVDHVKAYNVMIKKEELDIILE